MITTELLRAIVDFDTEAEYQRCRDESERPSCLACGGDYYIEPGFVPAPLCDGCAHSFVDEIAAGLLDVQHKIGKEERYLEKQGVTVAERSYRVGWNDAMRRAMVLVLSLAPAQRPGRGPSDDEAIDLRSPSAPSAPAPSAARTPDR